MDAQLLDVIVLTQSCDLAESKVDHVTMCPHVALSVHKREWAAFEEEHEQRPTPKAWLKYCENLTKGRFTHMMVLADCTLPTFENEHRIVDFREVYSMPVKALEAFAKSNSGGRVRLVPPYREHLSQAFARFFMRVGLPSTIRPESLANTTTD